MEENKEKIPHHVVIIPDGNRRWAKERGKEPWEGHEVGAENIEKLIKFANRRGIDCLSFWGSSLDNLMKRPIREKKALLEIYKKYFTKLLEDEEIERNGVKVNVIGRWEEQFPESLKEIIKRVISKTQNYKKKILNFMLAYSGTDEMLEAIRRINDKYEKGTKITAKILKENLMTADIPGVDLMIRTGGEPHLSVGFMMWDLADAQLYFTDTRFPDFNEQKFEEALEDYASRKRRFGK